MKGKENECVTYLLGGWLFSGEKWTGNLLESEFATTSLALFFFFFAGIFTHLLSVRSENCFNRASWNVMNNDYYCPPKQGTGRERERGSL